MLPHTNKLNGIIQSLYTDIRGYSASVHGVLIQNNQHVTIHADVWAFLNNVLLVNNRFMVSIAIETACFASVIVMGDTYD